MHENWLNRKNEDWSNHNLDTIIDFGRVYEDLGLSPHDFSGTILAGGVGGFVPERAFFCSPESKFKQLQSWVNQLVICDENFYHHSTNFREPIVNQILYEGSGQEINDNKIVDIIGSFWEVLENIDLFYDAITFCRIPDLPDQLTTNKIALLIHKLNSGGMALLSGSYRYHDANLTDITKLINRLSGVRANLTQLTDGGDLCNRGVDGHYGIVIRKS